jgi:hypothetical protein
MRLGKGLVGQRMIGKLIELKSEMLTRHVWYAIT